METASYYDYDEKNDILYIYKKDRYGSKVKGSIDVGNFIIDINYDNNVSGIEILDFTEVMKNLGIYNTKEILQNIEKAQVKAVYKRDSIIVYYLIFYKLKDREEKIGSTIAVPIAK